MGRWFALLVLLLASLAAPAQAGFTLKSAAATSNPLQGAQLLEVRDGVRLLDIAKDSPADRAGFVPGDILTAVNGADVFGETSLQRAVAAQQVWAVRVLRAGRAMSATVALADISAPPGTAGRVKWTAAPLPKGPAAMAEAAGAIARVSAGPRVALVIGNSAYGGSLGALRNPANDARLMADALRQTGFDVEVVSDADQKEMKRAIARFGDRLARAGQGATGLFFYAGHGIQARGVNYLVPVGAEMESEADVDIEAVPADAVLHQMEVSSADTRIVILDACRNLPLTRSYRDGTRGLARMNAATGSFIAYSTAPGGVAADGSGANSPFVAALVRELQVKGQSIEATFRNVRAAVDEATQGQQTPWDSSSLLRNFMFTP